MFNFEITVAGKFVKVRKFLGAKLGSYTKIIQQILQLTRTMTAMREDLKYVVEVENQKMNVNREE